MRKSKLVVDHLNFGLFFLALKIERESEVYYLFKSRIQIVEKIVAYFFRLRGIRPRLVRLKSIKSYRSQSDICDRLAFQFVEKLSHIGQLDSYQKQRVRDFVYGNLYRSISILEFVKNNQKLSNTDKVFLSRNKFSRLIVNCGAYDEMNIGFYRNIGLALDSSFQEFYSPNQNRYGKNIIKGFLKCLNSAFNVSMRPWPVFLIADLVSVLHPRNAFREVLSQDEITNKVDKHATFHNNFRIIMNNQKYKVRRLGVFNIAQFFLHIFKSLRVCFSVPHITLGNRLELVSESIDLFFLIQMLQELKCKVVYSVYESNNALLLLHAATTSHTCISLVSSFSAGYFPAQYNISHRAKNSDVYFVWGRLLSELYTASGDRSKFHIIAGYTGSGYLENFKKEAELFFSNSDKRPIICIYDTSLYDDLFVNKNEMLDFVSQISEYSISKGLNVIIKTKRYNKLYSDLIKKHTASIEISDQLASISAGLRADFSVGYLTSTPLLLLGSYQRNVVFFDPRRACWSEYYNYFSERIAHTLDDVFKEIDNVASGKYKSGKHCDFQLVNFFNDDRYQERVADYINSILRSKESTKNAILLGANAMYEKKYGKEVILSKYGY